MSLLRYDVTTNDWVIFAPERSRRPHDLKNHSASTPFAEKLCPFCPGNEFLAGPETYSQRSNSGAWFVRVVANKSPALRVEEDEHRNRSRVDIAWNRGFGYCCGWHGCSTDSIGGSVGIAAA